MKTFVTSDQHFSHNNLLYLSNLRHELFGRDVQKMNQFYIDTWNKVVSEEDVVYQLGDFYIGSSKEEYLDILSQLNGKIIFIKGNHDNRKFVNLAKKMGYEYHDIGKKIKLNKLNIMFSHYPINIDPWPYKRNDNLLNIHGHIHEETKSYNNFNVCVDSQFEHYGEPIELEVLINKFKTES